jgi:hypothetical protein
MVLIVLIWKTNVAYPFTRIYIYEKPGSAPDDPSQLQRSL